MISFQQFKREDGSIDWAAFRQAEIEAGERCWQCHAYIISIFDRTNDVPAIRRFCEPCRRLRDDTGDVDHESRIRCPHCRLSAPVAWDQARAYSCEGLYRDGETELRCVHCGEVFTVQVHVRYEYLSQSLKSASNGRRRKR